MQLLQVFTETARREAETYAERRRLVNGVLVKGPSAHPPSCQRYRPARMLATSAGVPAAAARRSWPTPLDVQRAQVMHRDLFSIHQMLANANQDRGVRTD